MKQAKRVKLSSAHLRGSLWIPGQEGSSSSRLPPRDSYLGRTGISQGTPVESLSQVRKFSQVPTHLPPPHT